jgi:SAM-dependent methyltransferase
MGRRLPDNHFLNPTLARIYDVTCGWSEDYDFYLSLANRPHMDILDLGCGTGLLCDAYAGRGHTVVGVDPAQAMLDEAAKKPNGGVIDWVQGYAQDFASERRFDLIVMTGHAFQTLLDESDVRQLFSVVRQHLKDNGRLAFESRNPRLDWAGKWHGRTAEWESDQGRFSQATRVMHASGDTLTFEHTYQFSDQRLDSISTLRFLSRSRIEELLVESGLSVTDLYGDWDTSPFDEASSPEMIFVTSPQETTRQQACSGRRHM